MLLLALGLFATALFTLIYSPRDYLDVRLEVGTWVVGGWVRGWAIQTYTHIYVMYIHTHSLWPTGEPPRTVLGAGDDGGLRADAPGQGDCGGGHHRGAAGTLGVWVVVLIGGVDTWVGGKASLVGGG